MQLEDQHHVEIDAVYSTGELYITAECRRCPWIGEIEVPVVLADVIERAEQHVEVCPGIPS